ncbi:hypothetical protein RDG78_001223 [Vibrio vulnificus]|nr:hypothetical protein [Vibrio vulnificus]
MKLASAQGKTNRDITFFYSLLGYCSDKPTTHSRGPDMLTRIMNHFFRLTIFGALFIGFGLPFYVYL